MQGDRDHPLAGAKYSRVTDFEGSENDVAISRDGRFIVFRSDRDGPVDTWLTQLGSGEFVNLTRGGRPSILVRNAGFTPDGSQVWLGAIVGGDRLRIMPLMGGAQRPFLKERGQNVAWSADGSRLVYHTNEPGDPMFVADRSGSNAREIYRLKPGGHSHYPVWSKDGQWIYFISGIWETREMDLWRISPDSLRAEKLTNHNADLRYLSLLDERTLLYVAPDHDGAGPWLWAYDLYRGTTRRISSGLEVYTSVDVSGDGRRVVGSVSATTANLWRVPILDRVAGADDVKPVPLPSVRAFAPRYGGSSLFYLSSRGGGDGLWRYDNGQALEIWRGSEGSLLEPAAVSFDGRRVAVILRKQGKRTLTLLSGDGGDVWSLSPELDITTAASWSPDGQWIVAGATDSAGTAGLFKIPVQGGAPQRLATGIASNPVWSPDGSIIVYTGPIVGIMGTLQMVRSDGTPLKTPEITVRVGTEHYRFAPGGRQLIYVPTPTQADAENFWSLDLISGQSRRLSSFDVRSMRTFDVTPDGKQIVFDRIRENSDIVLIDLPK
jgi:Tol biopolymer transport system component